MMTLVSFVFTIYVAVLFTDPTCRCCHALLISRSGLSRKLSADIRRTVAFTDKYIRKKNVKYDQLRMSSTENDAVASTLPETSAEMKPKREYVIQILNAIEELKRDEWNALLDANSR